MKQHFARITLGVCLQYPHPRSVQNDQLF